MKIVLAFDSFKGCISAHEACQAAAEVIEANLPETQVVQIPMSDGGEGLVNAIRYCRSEVSSEVLQSIQIHAHSPLMEPIIAEYIMEQDGKTAYMEMASTCGLPLVPADKRNPMRTTTYGVGEMMADAIRKGAEHIVIGIGGSATNDGGMGMIQALRDKGIGRNEIPGITVACDVNNPLCGPKGASAVFGPQKGATPEMIHLLDTRLKEFAERAVAEGYATTDMMNYPGAGAAGGLGFGLMAYCGAELKSGIDILLDIAGFDERIQGADMIITGEGKSDEQTLMGKVPHGILRRCRKVDIPVCLLSGAIEDTTGALLRSFDRMASINEGDPRPLEELLTPQVATENLQRTILRLLHSTYKA